MNALRSKLLEILDKGTDMTIATLRPDGYPQATTVSYVHDGLDIYFGCGGASQKARNLAARPEVSLTINLPYEDWDHIIGVSAAGLCSRVTDSFEVGRFSTLTLAKFPQVLTYAVQDSGAEMAVFKIRLKVASVLDYTQGFGHNDLVTLEI